jgi:hypothetical protein
MPTIIVVLGAKNSGKTSAVRKFLEDYANIPNQKKDITVVVPLKKRTWPKHEAIGVTSAGDLAATNSSNYNEQWKALRGRLQFLEARDCYSIVTAARTSQNSKNIQHIQTVGQAGNLFIAPIQVSRTLQEAIACAARLNWNLLVVETNINGIARTPQQIADLIWRHL